MSIIFWILLIIVIIIISLYVAARAVHTGFVWYAIKYIFLLIIILTLYYFIGLGFQMAVESWSPRSSRQMELWDNIWYILFIIMMMFILSVLIKSSKNSAMKTSKIVYVMYSVVFVILYTIIYYLVMFYDQIPYITGIVFACTSGLGMIILILKYLGVSPKISSPFHVLFFLSCMVFIMALFILLYYVLNKVYDFLA